MPEVVIDAILPAGGRLAPATAQTMGHIVKALVKFDGESMLDTVIKAVMGSGRIRRFVVIGGEEIREKFLGTEIAVLPELPTGPENMFAGLSYLKLQPDPPTHVLLCTTDLPFVSRASVSEFLDQCPVAADVCVPLIRKAAFEDAYPGTTSTFVHLREGDFTLGGMFLLSVSAMVTARPYIQKVFENRKSKLGMARLLGITFLMRFALKSLSLDHVEKKIRALLRCSGTALPDSPVELAYDVDDQEDFDAALRFVKVATPAR